MNIENLYKVTNAKNEYEAVVEGIAKAETLLISVSEGNGLYIGNYRDGSGTSIPAQYTAGESDIMFNVAVMNAVLDALYAKKERVTKIIAEL